MHVISLLSAWAQKALEEKYFSSSFAHLTWHQVYKRCNKYGCKLQEILIYYFKNHNIAIFSKH